ncbi:MAG: TIGR02677 family protein, partial [Candidatus Dormibacteraceae bacterium]
AVKSAEIAAGLRSLPEAPLDALLTAVAAREAADAAPDPGAQADAAAIRLGDWRDRWAGLRSWFVGDRRHPSQAQLLRGRARGAIPELLAAVTLLQDRRSGRSDRSADYRTLALWFARATSDREAHRLWRAAFGLASSRHLAIDAEMLDAIETEPVAPTTRWQDAPPVAIAPRLRQTGRYQRRGMPSRIVDRSPARELLARRLGAERLEIESARRRLATGRPIRLSDLGCLDEREFPLFLTLLGDALAAGPPPPGGTRTTSGDGSIEIHLVPAGDGSRFALQTPSGQFAGPDHLVTFADLLGDLLPMAAGEGP